MGQIRVHLQYTGHPIGNDVLYLFENAPDRSARGMGADRAASLSSSTIPPPAAAYEEDDQNCNNSSNNDGFGVDPFCTHCPNLAPTG